MRSDWTVDQVNAAELCSVVVLYASAYGNTAALAQAISRGITKSGVGVQTLNLEQCRCDAQLVGHFCTLSAHHRTAQPAYFDSDGIMSAVPAMLQLPSVPSRDMTSQTCPLTTICCGGSIAEVEEAVSSAAGFVIGSPTLGGHMPTQVRACDPAHELPPEPVRDCCSVRPHVGSTRPSAGRSCRP